MFMKFHVVYKYDYSLPQTTPPVEKEAVAAGMYKQLCHDLHNAIIETGEVKTGYVRLYGNSSLMREYCATESIVVIAPETASAE
jgi:hypothetical protein